jgi:hypothetical protein
MVGRGHTDVFTGVCVNKKKDNCSKYAEQGTIASYGRGKGHEEEIAVALVNSLVSRVGLTQVASLIPNQAPMASQAPIRTSNVTSGFIAEGLR